MKKSDLKKLTFQELDEAIYGPGGLLEKLKKEIKIIGPRKISVKMGLSVQNVYRFLDCDNQKMETIGKFIEGIK